MRQWIAIILITAFCGIDLHAADEQPHIFKVYPTVTKMLEGGTMNGYGIMTESFHLNFFPPGECLLETDTRSRRLKLTPVDHKCVITFQMTTNDPALLQEPRQLKLHEMVQARYTNSVTYGLQVFTGIAPGCSFDVEFISTNKMRMITRTAFIPVPNGIAEATLTCAKPIFEEQRFRFARMLGSLQVTDENPGGLRRPNRGKEQTPSR